MTDREQYTPGPASGAQVRKDGETVDARSRQGTAPPAGKSLAGADRPGAAARVGAVRRRWEPGYGGNHGEAHHGGSAHAACDRNHSDASRRSQGARVQLGWQRHAVGARSPGGGTRLTLWTSIDRRFIAMGAAGWHVCFDVLDHLLGGTPIGRIVGTEAMKFGGWQRLNAEYAKQFGIETPNRPSKAESRRSH